MNKELLGTRKMSAGYVNGKINTIRLTLGEETVGTKLVLQKNETGFRLLKNENEEGYPVEVKKMTRGAGKPQLYINIQKEWFCEFINYKMYKIDNGYEFEETNPTERFKRSTENQSCISPSGSVMIPSKYLNKLISGYSKEEYCFKIEEHYSPQIYLKISVVKIEPGQKRVPDINANIISRNYNENQMIHYACIGKSLYMNRFFMKASGLKEKSTVVFSFSEDGSLILARENMTCDICGKAICQSIEGFEKIDVCDSCDNALKILKKHAVKENNNLAEVKKQLLIAEKSLREIHEQIIGGK